MSRSYRKNICGAWTSATSEAYDKKKWHKRFRQHERVALKKLCLSNCISDHLSTHVYDVSNVWSMVKDGKCTYQSLKDIYCIDCPTSRTLSEFISKRDRAIRKYLFK